MFAWAAKIKCLSIASAENCRSWRAIFVSSLILISSLAHGVENGIRVHKGEKELLSVVRVLTPHRDQTKNPGKYQTCTGTIIGTRIVITAAHCLEDIPSKPYVRFIRTNEKDEIALQREGVDWVTFRFRDAPAHDVHQIVQWLRSRGASVPLDLRSLYTMDVALILLASTIPEGFIPVELPDIDFRPSIGLAFQFAGFGENIGQGDLGILYKTIHSVQQDIIPTPASQFYSRGSFPLRSTSCSGDSGSGAMMVASNGDFRLIGILAKGDWFCPDGGGSKFVNIQDARNWVELVKSYWEE